jgi:hypothetical protein
MFQISDLTDSGAAAEGNHANLAGRELNKSVLSFLCHELCITTCTADYLSSMAYVQFDIMDSGTQGDISEIRTIPGPDFNTSPGYDSVSHLETERS